MCHVQVSTLAMEPGAVTSWPEAGKAFPQGRRQVCRRSIVADIRLRVWNARV